MVADKDPRQTNRNPRTRWRPSRRLPGGRRRSFNAISLVQQAMACVLKLDFQLECMDYRRENWYHADLDYKTFSALQLARGESIFSFARDMALVSMKNLSRSGMSGNVDSWRAKLLWASKVLPMPLIGLLLIERVCAPPDTPFDKAPEVKALLDLDLSAAIKVFLAKQLATDFTEGASSLIEQSVMIGERNRAALEELKEAIRDGCKKVAIFYGGGHMPDMDRRLRKEFGLVPKKVEWQTAWSIKTKREKKDDRLSTILHTLAQISGWPLDRYQTGALMLFSVVLAVDLWFWEVLLNSLNKYSIELVVAVVHLLDQASQL
ncbi:hypothetical protein KP509_17G028100 [Ceratopteris richardii]|nr:hypothetical protein KP509_17G028100 [Ceratopteris richardii]